MENYNESNKSSESNKSNESKYVIIKYDELIIIKIDENETLKTLKNKIYKIINIHPYFQRIIGFNEYNGLIRNEKKLSLEIKNSIRVYTGCGIRKIEIHQNDNIKILKQRIYQKLKIPENRQIIKFGKFELNDDYKSLLDYNKEYDNKLLIDENNFIDVSFKKEENITVNISIGDKIEKFNMDYLDTVRNLYSLLETRIGRQIDINSEILKFENEYLFILDSSLVQNGFEGRNNFKINLIKHTFCIKIITSTGKLIKIYCEESDKIKKIKKIIEKFEDIPSIEQIILYAGDILEDNMTLADNDIEKGDSLFMKRTASIIEKIGPCFKKQTKNKVHIRTALGHKNLDIEENNIKSGTPIILFEHHGGEN